MFRRLLVIDLLLIVLLVFGGLRIWEDWLTFKTTHRVENIQAASEAISAQPAGAAPVSSNLSDWVEIAARNPFSFDRTDTPIIATQPAGETIGPKPVLFGIVSLGKDPLAMMASGTAVENRNARPLHVGESLDGWELVEIQQKSVVVRAGARRESVIMDDPTAQIPRGAERTANGGGSVIQASPPASTPGSNNARPAPAASANGGLPPLPSTPVDATGQPKKGRWVRSPFGDVFVEEDR